VRTPPTKYKFENTVGKHVILVFVNKARHCRERERKIKDYFQ
jgi:hypothetical protein